LKAREEQQTEGRMFDLTHNKERSDREEEKREMEDDGDLDETLKYNHHMGGQETSGLNSFELANQLPGAFRLRSSDRNTDLKLIPKQNKNERYYQHLNDGDDLEEQKEETHTANNQDEDFQRDPNDDPGASWRPH